MGTMSKTSNTEIQRGYSHLVLNWGKEGQEDKYLSGSKKRVKESKMRGRKRKEKKFVNKNGTGRAETRRQ